MGFADLATVLFEIKDKDKLVAALSEVEDFRQEEDFFTSPIDLLWTSYKTSRFTAYKAARLRYDKRLIRIICMGEAEKVFSKSLGRAGSSADVFLDKNCVRAGKAIITGLSLLSPI